MSHLYWALLCFVLVWHKGLAWWVLLIWRMLLLSLVWCHVTQASGMLLEAMQASAISHKKSIPWIFTTPSACTQEEHIWSRPEPKPKENTEDRSSRRTQNPYQWQRGGIHFCNGGLYSEWPADSGSSVSHTGKFAHPGRAQFHPPPTPTSECGRGWQAVLCLTEVPGGWGVYPLLT